MIATACRVVRQSAKLAHNATKFSTILIISLENMSVKFSNPNWVSNFSDTCNAWYASCEIPQEVAKIERLSE